RAHDSLDWSRRVEKETIASHGDDWRRVAASVRSHPKYHGLELKPQLGLVPIGPDPISKLEEFWLPRTGSEPVRNEDGWLVREQDFGVVLVLVPGGTARIGSDAGPRVYDNEVPAHDVELAPFFIGKYELTQGQFERLFRFNPSKYTSARSKAKPVETVSWNEVSELLPRCGLHLPTEAQWEYACRAGTGTLWYFGDDRASLLRDGVGRFNAASHNIPDAGLWPQYEDGFSVHTAVGRYEPNAFGLYDMHGNIAELTRGPNTNGYRDVRHAPGDGLILGEPTPRAIQRGGSYFKAVEDARSAARVPIDKDAKYDNVGLRVVRPIQ
ncbi:MAG: formylglycine-generating enzyme family protein, partial [Planctomycetes bacterium]|nr:formylglycine-generating enzyme family protein [Planctomycetota bacterium]